MKKLFAIFALAAGLYACNSGETIKTEVATNPNVHKIEVVEILQANQYTYLRATEGSGEVWLALPKKTDINVGETWYYEGGMEMTNFQSKDLNRTFTSVLFIEGIRKDPNAAPQAGAAPAEGGQTAPVSGTQPAKPTIEKANVKVEAVKGGITIADLYSNKDKYAGQVVKIKGQITKMNTGIMDRTWIHLQDGTDSKGNFDLTVTTTASNFKVGDQVTVEGKIALNKDFGYGYAYAVLMEDAVVK